MVTPAPIDRRLSTLLTTRRLWLSGSTIPAPLPKKPAAFAASIFAGAIASNGMGPDDDTATPPGAPNSRRCCR